MTDEQGRVLAGAVVVLCGVAASAIPPGPARAATSPVYMVCHGLGLMGCYDETKVHAMAPMGPVLDLVFSALCKAFVGKP